MGRKSEQKGPNSRALICFTWIHRREGNGLDRKKTKRRGTSQKLESGVTGNKRGCTPQDSLKKKKELYLAENGAKKRGGEHQAFKGRVGRNEVKAYSCVLPKMH